MHPQSSSASTTSSVEESAYPWILEHVLTYPGTYEIPLRTMYTLNSTPSSQRHPRYSPRPETPSLSSSASSLNNSPQSADFPQPEQSSAVQPTVTDHFKQCLMDHISQLPSQPFSLPPSFITSFVRRCFTEDLCMVDFTQALTAIDYLKDLDTRRRRELSNALQRLGLDRDVVRQDSQYISRHPKLAEWFSSMQEKDRKVEALYTQVYIGLRRWTLINEMRLEPFSKANSVAMLNTLYPPSAVAPPTRQLTPAIMAAQRNAFFRYITAVEQNGRSVLRNLEHQGQRSGDSNGWAVVRDIVDKYLRTSNAIIDECMNVAASDLIGPSAAGSSRSVDIRSDSGIGFSPSERPATSTSNHSKSSGPSIDKPLPASPHSAQTTNLPATATRNKTMTKLERFAREVRNFKNRNDVKELELSIGRPPTAESTEYPTYQTASTARRPDLRKMKSTASLSPVKRPHFRSGSDESRKDLSIDSQKRAQLLGQAQREREQRLQATNYLVASTGLRRHS